MNHRVLGVCAILFCWLLGSSTPALGQGLVENRKHRFLIDLNTGWQKVPQPEESRTPLIGYRHRKNGATLTVNRVDYPNIRAWRKKTRDAYYAEIEKGVAEKVRDYRRIALRTKHMRKIPTMELSFSYRDRRREHIVLMRFIFYRRYSLSMTLSMPMRAFKRQKRFIKRVRNSFAPLY